MHMWRGWFLKSAHLNKRPAEKDCNRKTVDTQLLETVLIVMALPSYARGPVLSSHSCLTCLLLLLHNRLYITCSSNVHLLLLHKCLYRTCCSNLPFSHYKNLDFLGLFLSSWLQHFSSFCCLFFPLSIDLPQSQTSWLWLLPSKPSEARLYFLFLLLSLGLSASREQGVQWFEG